MKKNTNTLTMLIACALWLGFAGSGQAQSTIAYFNGPAFQFPAGYESAPLDFDRDGTNDFEFAGGAFLCTADIPVSGCTATYDIIPSGTNATLAQGNVVVILPALAPIGGATFSNAVWRITKATTTATIYFSQRYTNSGWSGPLNAAGEGYFGVRFKAADGLHYGWVRARMPIQMSTYFESTPVILEWAYETRPNTSIGAGAKPVAASSKGLIVRPEFFRLSWQSEAGKLYQVQSKEHLSDPIWQNLDFNIVASGTNTSVDVPMKKAAGFYRAVLTD